MSSNKVRCSRPAGIVVCMMSVVLPLFAQSHAHYSRAELHRMMREATTADQCGTLATWFREEEATFRGKADAENRDYERYSHRLVPAKYPTPADNARTLKDYYAYKANQMAAQAVRYETQLSRLDPGYRPITAAMTVETRTAATASVPLSQSEKMLLDRIERLERQVGQLRTP